MSVSIKTKGETLERGLTNRHIQLMSIGGAIGTGLFMGAGKTISTSGTSIILTYAIIGFFLFFMMRAMGEILLANLKFKSFADFCTHYIGPSAGYFIGWSYWMSFVIGAIADCIIIGGYMKQWYPELPVWIPAFTVLAIILGLNLVAVRLFGELEFWFALIKVVAICALIATGLIMVAISFMSPSGIQASLGHLIQEDTVFPHGIRGFLAGFQMAIFSFGGIELIGTTAAEAKNPTKTLPKAINAVPVRIMVFYVLSLMTIISVSSWAEISPDKSPFVQLFVLAGLPAAAAIISLVVITSAMSAANSAAFATSRMLFGLSTCNQANKAFSKLSTKSVPVNSLLFSCGVMILGLSILFVSPSAMQAFTLLSTIAAILFVFVWAMILVAYIQYRRKDPALHEASQFKMPGGVPMAYGCLIFFAGTVFILSLDSDTAKGLAIVPVWFLILGFFYKKSATRTQKMARLNHTTRA
ncbi:amino acid permease [Pseudomonas fluorescens]|uniref:amino acid permease n=1 Tax=Pseudomonas fluorescens TaxID=294 RepID=UPI00178445AC|nr:amino acid permease [Pseudomonas fluorescens]MBD8146743.1 amino acid permease [Pseudomonas fluorescens]MBD8175187.1 amino acid permease [Pseudomonas fluorescens]MBD8743643.1 amino acid permease [Pseudomonas fluorescens]MBD8753468.1 amino acid permease [Pseudomonas fluorescens]MBD8759557.1 amino acid permease [Pseudomonas fluorescens]